MSKYLIGSLMQAYIVHQKQPTYYFYPQKNPLRGFFGASIARLLPLHTYVLKVKAILYFYANLVNTLKLCQRQSIL